MNLRSRLRKLEARTQRRGAAAPDRTRAAFQLWSRAAEAGTDAFAVFTGCGLRRQLDTVPRAALAPDELGAFEAWEREARQQTGRTLEEARAELERSGYVRELLDNLRGRI